VISRLRQAAKATATRDAVLSEEVEEGGKQHLRRSENKRIASWRTDETKDYAGVVPAVEALMLFKA